MTVKDHILQRNVEIRADLLVLSAGMTAADTEELSGIMKLNRNPEGFFIEAHVKLRPVDMPSEGIFLCGTAHGPKLHLRDHRPGPGRGLTGHHLSGQTGNQAVRHHGQGGRGTLRQVSHLRPLLPLRRPRSSTRRQKVIEIDEALCHGCGVCTGVCPRQTIQLELLRRRPDNLQN